MQSNAVLRQATLADLTAMELNLTFLMSLTTRKCRSCSTGEYLLPFLYRYNIDNEFMWCPCKGCICENSKGPPAAVSYTVSLCYCTLCVIVFSRSVSQDPAVVNFKTQSLYWREQIHTCSPLNIHQEHIGGTSANNIAATMSSLSFRISIFKFMVSEEYPKPNIIFTGGSMPMLQYVSGYF